MLKTFYFTQNAGSARVNANAAKLQYYVAKLNYYVAIKLYQKTRKAAGLFAFGCGANCDCK